MCTEADTHTSATTACREIPVHVHISGKGCFREGPNQEGGLTVPLKGTASSSEILGLPFLVGRHANHENISLREKSLPYPQETHPASSMWNFLKPHPLANFKTSMRGNFLKKHPPILGCHRWKMVGFVFFACKGKKKKNMMLSLKCPHFQMPSSSKVVPSNWVTAPLKCHTQYFLFNPLILQSLAVSRHVRKLPYPEDLVWVYFGLRKKEVRKRGENSERTGGVGSGEPQARPRLSLGQVALQMPQ